MDNRTAIRLAAHAALLALVIEGTIGAALGRRRRPLDAARLRKLARQSAVAAYATWQRRVAHRAKVPMGETVPY